METEWNNFDALNIPADHPARAMQDTFWIKTDGKPMVDESGHSSRPVMRTHTSGVQIRTMVKAVQENRDLSKNPIMIVAPGKVFRNESTDATHEAQFHQIEGLIVGENISMAHLKGALLEFFKQFSGPETEIRFRPSFFPFVEPGAEVDVKMKKKDGTIDWVEVLGAGLVHPNVLENCGIDSKKYSGFAFGFGIDRMVMLGTGLTDIRYLYQGDLRINQF
jgi:phenylalanyl-tRNA synthetase alpha chain